MKPQPVSFLSQKNRKQNSQFHPVSRETVLLVDFMQKRHFFCDQFHVKLGETGDFFLFFWLKNETGCGFMGETG